MTPFRKFCDRWKTGCGSELCSVHGTKVVLCRGQIPSHVLFAGEAPGLSENVLGRPFVGPAGKLLDDIVKQAMPIEVAINEYGNDIVEPVFRTAFTNLVCCLPIDENGDKTIEPSVEAIEDCSRRLEEFVALAKPKMIVCVGALAEKWIMGGSSSKKKVLKDFNGKLLAMVHPAAILRANLTMRGLMVQRCIVSLRGALEDLAENK